MLLGQLGRDYRASAPLIVLSRTSCGRLPFVVAEGHPAGHAARHSTSTESGSHDVRPERRLILPEIDLVRSIRQRFGSDKSIRLIRRVMELATAVAFMFLM